MKNLITNSTLILITLTSMIAYSFPLTGDADNQIRSTNGFSNDSDYLSGGVTFSISF